jgi:two-component system, NarL family, captular synthesis response regulator RcsB
MLNKVLVADSFDCISLSVGQILKQHSIFETDYAKYYDDTYLKIKRAIYDKVPFNLLISDLDFKTDCRKTKLNSGEELILAIKKIQPDIKIIVFSEEMKSFRIKSLFKDYNINAFVYKGRNSVIELDKAIQTIFVDSIEKPSLKFETLSHKSLVDIREYDISLLKSISNGLTLDEISKNFKKLGIHPNSGSSIEKCINSLRIHFDAKNKVHLIAIAKDLGLI